MHTQIKAKPLYEISSKIITHILTEREKRDQVYLDKLKKKHSRKKRSILGFVIPEIVITDDDAVRLANLIASKEMFGYWKSQWAWNVFSPIEKLKSICLAAMSESGDGWVTIDKEVIVAIEWFDDNWVSEYLNGVSE